MDLTIAYFGWLHSLQSSAGMITKHLKGINAGINKRVLFISLQHVNQGNSWLSWIHDNTRTHCSGMSGELPWESKFPVEKTTEKITDNSKYSACLANCDPADICKHHANSWFDQRDHALPKSSSNDLTLRQVFWPENSGYKTQAFRAEKHHSSFMIRENGWK